MLKAIIPWGSKFIKHYFLTALIPLSKMKVAEGRSSSEISYASEPLTLGKASTQLYL